MSSDLPQPQENLVLVVDDDPVMRRMSRYALARENLRVEEATDGAQGLEMFQRLHPNLVLLDGMMPVMDGFATCAELRRLPEGAFTPVLMVTALDDEDSVDRAFNAGATDYITKPVHWGVLRQRVLHLLQASMVETVQARMEAVVRQALDAIITCDSRCIIESVNPSAEKILGCAASDLVGQDLHTFLVEQPGSTRCLPGASGEVYGKRRDGSLVPLEYSMNEFTALGASVQVIILHDISERKQAEAALRDSEERYRTIITSVAEGLLVTDANSIITSCNTSAERIFGASAQQIRGRSIDEMTWEAIHEDGTLYPIESIPSTITHKTGLSQRHVVLGLRRPDGSVLWLMVSTHPLGQVDANGAYGVVVSFLDITERQELMKKLRYSSTHDILTNLYNRAYFEEEMIRQERGRQFPVSIVMADVDDMKESNDRYGHSAGDELLRHAAQILRTGFRAEDVVARVGGDEFAVILPDTDEIVAERVLERVMHTMDEWNQQNPMQVVRLSVGCATARAGQLLTDAWKKADARMYQVKLAHKSSVATGGI